MAIALELLQRGYTVFGGCPQPANVEALQREAASNSAASSRLNALPMDVTSDAQVAAAAATVQGWADLRPSRRRLLCVVNCAGVGTGDFVEWMRMADFERKVVVRVSKAFVPQVRRSAQLVAQRAAQAWKRPTASSAPPRMLIVASMAGRLPTPLLASYCATCNYLGAVRVCIALVPPLRRSAQLVVSLEALGAL